MRQGRIRVDSQNLDLDGSEAVFGAGHDGGAGLLAGAHRFAGEKRFIDGGRSVANDPIRREALTGANAEPIARTDLREGPIFLDAVRQ